MAFRKNIDINRYEVVKVEQTNSIKDSLVMALTVCVLTNILNMVKIRLHT